MKVRSFYLASATAALLSITAMSASAQSNPPVSPTSGWAVVSARGDLLGGQNATAAKPEGKGHYEVDFSGPVNRCAYNATIGGDTKVSGPGSIVVARIKDVPNGLLVGIYNLVTLVPENNRFMLTVTC